MTKVANYSTEQNQSFSKHISRLLMVIFCTTSIHQPILSLSSAMIFILFSNMPNKTAFQSVTVCAYMTFLIP